QCAQVGREFPAQPIFGGTVQARVKLETKDRIASRFLERPLLHMLVRALVFSFWFRTCFLSIPLILVGLLLVQLRILRSTPSDFSPAVRINLVEWFQARSLEHTASIELQRGKADQGFSTFRSALARDPGNLARIRRFLRQVDQKAEPPKLQVPVLGQAFWAL